MDVLQSLFRGNLYAANYGTVKIDFSEKLRYQLSQTGQRPQLALVGCADSRVIPEAIFNCGLGQILTTRNAGNTIGPAEYATLHYGVFSLGIGTIAVMGHSGCGAVTAAMHHNPDPYLQPVLQPILSSVDAEMERLSDFPLTVNEAAKLNIRQQVKCLTNHEMLQPLVASGRLQVVGLYYDQETGFVEEVSLEG